MEANRFALVSQKTHEGKVSMFEVPKLYVKTTLITMDGIGNQRPEAAGRGEDKHPNQHPEESHVRPDDGLQ